MLPDTQMDLIKAQQEYAQLLEGADMILMLSSMLHSIGGTSWGEDGLCGYQPSCGDKAERSRFCGIGGCSYGCRAVPEFVGATTG